RQLFRRALTGSQPEAPRRTRWQGRAEGLSTQASSGLLHTESVMRERLSDSYFVVAILQCKLSTSFGRLFGSTLHWDIEFVASRLGRALQSGSFSVAVFRSGNWVARACGPDRTSNNVLAGNNAALGTGGNLVAAIFVGQRGPHCADTLCRQKLHRDQGSILA